MNCRKTDVLEVFWQGIILHLVVTALVRGNRGLGCVAIANGAAWLSNSDLVVASLMQAAS